MYSYGSPHMAAQKQDDQLERTFSSYVRIQAVVLKTYIGRWTIGRSGERRSGRSVLAEWHDDDWFRRKLILYELIRDVLLWIPTHGRAKAGRPARTYIQQLCEDTGCCPEDLPRAMNDREEWRERVRDIRATNAIWWWWWWSFLKIVMCILIHERYCKTK